MKITMVLAGHTFPPDIRVEKEARTLRDAGYELDILCEQRDSGRPLEDRWEDCGVFRLKRMRTPIRYLNAAIRFIFHFDIAWHFFLKSYLNSKPTDAFHVHDLPVCKTVIRLAKKRGIPTYVDLHENYPAHAQTDYETHGFINRLFLRVVNNVERWTRYENWAASQAAHIFVVVDEAKERLSNQGIDTDKITVVENTEDVDFFSGISIKENILQQYKDDFVISYVGGFGSHRGLQTAVEAMPSILKEAPEALLLIVGDGANRLSLEQQAERLGVKERVQILKWQPFDLVPSFIEASDVCLVPHLENAQTNATAPHKLFQYMLKGKPVIVSSCKPLARIVKELNSGLVFKAGDGEDLARAVIHLKDKESRRRMGEAGRFQVLNHRNWSVTSQGMVRIYESFSPQKRTA